MKNKIYISLLVALVLVVVGWQASPTKYEYKFDFNTTEKKCNELSAQGWELVAIAGQGGGSMSSNITEFVFKRAK